MEHDVARLAVPHSGNHLPSLNAMAFLNQPRLIMRICAKERFIVLDNNKLSVASQSTSAIDHDPTCGRIYGLPQRASDLYPLRTGNAALELDIS